MGAVRNVLPRLTVRGILTLPALNVQHRIGPGTGTDAAAVVFIPLANTNSKGLVVQGAGFRVCRTCNNLRTAAWRAKQKVAA